MDKELFTAQLKERLEERTSCEIRVQQTTKNNGIKLTALTIMQEGVNVTPSIYVEPWYELYNESEQFEDIIDKILELEEKYKIHKNIDFSSFLDFEKAKNGLRYKIINTEKNIEILNSIPHKDFLDLSKVYLVEVNVPEIGIGTILVSNDHMKAWGVTWEELDRYAAEMTEQHNPYCIFNMEKFAKNIVAELAKTEEDIPHFRMPPMEMYVLTNRENYLGAGVLLYKNVLKNFAKEKEDNIYILPSSTHEIILIPARIVWYTSINHLKEMVKEVNSTQVKTEEFLSDNVYFYDREADKIKIV